jgi:hypothetical protein
MAGDINIVAIVKGDERYVFMFDEDTRSETLRTLGRFASNPELSFSWYDAAVLSQKIRKTAQSSPCKASGHGPHFDHPVLRRGRSSQLTDDAGFPNIDLSASDDLWIGDDPVF